MATKLGPAPSASDPAAILTAGFAHHSAGRLSEAENAYRQVLAVWQNHAEALHLMGILAFQTDRPTLAIELISRAIRTDPGNATYFSNLASALRRVGRLGEAAAAAQQALKLDDNNAEALNNLANALADLGRNSEATDALRRLVALRPLLKDQRLLLARLLILEGHLEEAVEALLTLLGMNPLSAPAYTNLGVALRRLGRIEEAVAAYQSALAFAPGDPAVLNNLGVILQDQDHHDRAAACFRQAIAISPASVNSYLNLSLTAREEMNVDQAIALARAATTIDPALAEAHTALGVALLLRGELKEGFREYEWRSQMADFPSPQRHFSSPTWDGRIISGQTLLVYDEQGVGDTIQFARYVQLLKSRGIRVMLECNAQLVRLLSGLQGAEKVIKRFDPLPEHDFHVSLLSLPHRLGTLLYTIPANVPYLAADSELTAKWAARLGPRRGLRVGVVWAGNPEFKADRIRSPRLNAFLSLLDVPGVEMFALQKGAGRDDLLHCGPLPSSFTDLGADIGDFADTAAIMENLDLIISSCTAPAHLAGALGRPVWTVLPFAPDWRWLDNGLCTPWYPTMRLFRQDRRGDWTSVVHRVRTALEALAQDWNAIHDQR